MGVKMCEIWRRLKPLNFEPLAFENAARYLKSETNFLCRNDCRMPLPSLVKLGTGIPENRLVKCPTPLKLHGENMLSRQ